MALRTPLYEAHRTANATFVEFGGWEMPLQYAGIVSEHLAVRQAAGLFDVSHMAKILISGQGAWEFLTRLSTNDLPRKASRARYTHLLDPDGHILDDVIVTCVAPDRFFMVSNAGPRERVLGWLRTQNADVDIQDITFDYLCLALQGPKAARILQLVTTQDLASVKAFGAAHLDLLLGERLGTGRGPPSPAPPEAMGGALFGQSLGQDVEDYCLVTRTGYTGEDGFELFPPKALAGSVWATILAAGQEAGIRPVGLGARDTLRLEKGYLLSGMDFDGSQTPLECASEWLVKWEHEFIGREALAQQKEREGYDRLIGLQLQERGVPRHGCQVLSEGRSVGIITSGTLSPVLKIGIALARVRRDVTSEGSELSVVVRDDPLRAIVKKPPFV